LCNLRFGGMLSVVTWLVWAPGLVGGCTMTGALVYTNLDRLADTGLFLNEVWAVAGVVGSSLWEIVVEVTATPAALGVASAYVVLAVAAITVWCVIIQRTTQPLRSRS